VTITHRHHPAPVADRGEHPARSRRPRWPWYGAAAGVSAFLASLVAIPSQLTEADSRIGVEVLDELDRADHHVAFLLGLVSVGCLLAASTGWKRWADQWAGDSVAARTIPTALAATATVNLIGASFAGSLALYLPGGPDEGWLAAPEGQLAAFHGLDVGLLLGWWGTVVAALCVAGLALGTRRVLPRWMGVVSILLVLPPIGLAIGMALPGMPGFTMPLWLTVVSVGMVGDRNVRPRPGLAR
jgi:hypothetical protein